MNQKIAIIGRGTAGCYAVLYFLKQTNWDIDWFFDPNISPQAVGEGSTLDLPHNLYYYANFNVDELESIYGTPKLGIKKFNWGTGKEFIHTFPGGLHGIHFTATKLQEWILNFVKNNRRIKIIETSIDHDQIDADFIYDCSGKPKSYEEFFQSQYIPVNSVHVNQCLWEGARFHYTLCVARPYGWVFGIPLLNRCSIGYMYNNNINSLEEVKADIKNIFSQFNLIPSEQTNSFSFKNYYRRKNFQDRVVYSGNASFFLEPLEATSIYCMGKIQYSALDYFTRKKTESQANLDYQILMTEIENVIMLHYAAGSIYDNEFWKYAEENGRKNYATMYNNKRFQNILYSPDSLEEYGSWPNRSFWQNLPNLGIIKR